MSKHRKDIPHLPEREEMPPEVAALAVAADEDDEQPTIVLNSSEENLGLTYKEFRPGVLVGIAVGWATKTVREHQIATAATAVTATTVASAAITAGMYGALQQRDTPLAQSIPATSVITVAPPSATATSRPSATPSPPGTPPPMVKPATHHTRRPVATGAVEPPRVRPSDKPTRVDVEPERAQQTKTSKPLRTAAPTPTKAQPDKQPNKIATRPTSRAVVDVDLPTLPSTLSALPSRLPPVTSELPVVVGKKECVARVEVDPVADVCVLS